MTQAYPILLRNACLRQRYGIGLRPTVQAPSSSGLYARGRESITDEPNTLTAFKTIIISYDVAGRHDSPVRLGKIAS